MKNIHNIYFTHNKSNIIKVYQYDKGQILAFDETFANGTEVQFENGMTKVIFNSKILIPDIVLEKAGAVKAWIQLVNADNETTIYEILMLVEPRAKKNDYIEPEDEQSFREEVQQMIEEAGKPTPEEIEPIIKEYLDEHPVEPYDDSEIKAEINELQGGKQNVITDLDSIRSGANKGATALQEIPSDYAKKSDIPAPYDDSEIKEEIADINSSLLQKQNELVSGENIKTINGNSILGSGNIEIQGGGGSANPLDGKVICCIGDSYTEGTSTAFRGDEFEELPNYSLIRNNQSKFRTFAWWLAKLNPNTEVKNFALGGSVLARGYQGSSASGYKKPCWDKCFGIGTEAQGLNGNFSFQNIPYADIYFVQFGLNDTTAFENGVNGNGLNDGNTLSPKKMCDIARASSNFATTAYATDFTPTTYVAQTFQEGMSAVYAKCKAMNEDCQVIWLMSDGWLTHGCRNVIRTVCDFHGIDLIDMQKVGGSVSLNVKQPRVYGGYTSTATVAEDGSVSVAIKELTSGSATYSMYMASDQHPSPLSHEKKGKWLDKWLKKNAIV